MADKRTDVPPLGTLVANSDSEPASWNRFLRKQYDFDAPYLSAFLSCSRATTVIIGKARLNREQVRKRLLAVRGLIIDIVNGQSIHDYAGMLLLVSLLPLDQIEYLDVFCNEPFFDIGGLLSLLIPHRLKSVTLRISFPTPSRAYSALMSRATEVTSLTINSTMDATNILPRGTIVPALSLQCRKITRFVTNLRDAEEDVLAFLDMKNADARRRRAGSSGPDPLRVFHCTTIERGRAGDAILLHDALNDLHDLFLPHEYITSRVISRKQQAELHRYKQFIQHTLLKKPLLQVVRTPAFDKRGFTVDAIKNVLQSHSRLVHIDSFQFGIMSSDRARYIFYATAMNRTRAHHNWDLLSVFIMERHAFLKGFKRGDFGELWRPTTVSFVTRLPVPLWSAIMKYCLSSRKMDYRKWISQDRKNFPVVADSQKRSASSLTTDGGPMKQTRVEDSNSEPNWHRLIEKYMAHNQHTASSPLPTIPCALNGVPADRLQ